MLNYEITQGFTVGGILIIAAIVIIGYVVGHWIEKSIGSDGNWLPLGLIIIMFLVAAGLFDWFGGWSGVLAALIFVVITLIVGTIITRNSGTFVEFVIGAVVGGYIGNYLAMEMQLTDQTARDGTIIVTGFLVGLVISRVATLFKKS